MYLPWDWRLGPEKEDLAFRSRLPDKSDGYSESAQPCMIKLYHFDGNTLLRSFQTAAHRQGSY